MITKSGGNRVRGSVFEYLRNDAFDSANYFDSQRNADGSVIAEAGSAPTVPKSPLKLNQFGGSLGGALVKDRAFFFGSYEGYRLTAGRNFIQAVPSAAAWSRAVPAVAGLRRVHAPSACRRVDQPDSDIIQWQGNQEVTRTLTADDWTSKSTRTGRPTSASFTTSHEPRPSGRQRPVLQDHDQPDQRDLQPAGHSGHGAINEFSSDTTPRQHRGRGHQAGFENVALSLQGTVANAGIAGQGRLSWASPGLVR